MVVTFPEHKKSKITLYTCIIEIRRHANLNSWQSVSHCLVFTWLREVPQYQAAFCLILSVNVLDMVPNTTVIRAKLVSSPLYRALLTKLSP
jgi:hypothetical protein